MRHPLAIPALLLALHGQALTGAESDLAAQVAALPATSVREALRQTSLQVALERAAACREAGLTEEAAAWEATVTQVLAGPAAAGPTVNPRFLKPLLAAEGNPYLADLEAWAERFLASPDQAWPRAVPGTPVFNGTGKEYGTRDQGILMGTLLWLVAHPQSPVVGNQDLFARYLRRADAYAEDYLANAGGYKDHQNDFFALGPAAYAWNAGLTLWPDLLTPARQELWRAAAAKARDFWIKIYQDGQNESYLRMGRYTNRDLGVANILVNLGQITGDQACLDAARTLVHAQEANLFPDGAFAYIGSQNEVVNYHDVNITFLMRYHLVTGDPKALDLIVGSQWYGPLSMEPRGVGEFWTAPSWKHSWNGGSGYGGEIVVGLSGNRLLRTQLDAERTRNGPPAFRSFDAPDPLDATFWRSDVKPQALPADYTVRDRNLAGLRGRYGRFSYAATARVTPDNEPGMATLVGALTMDPDPKVAYPLQAGVLGVAAKVKTTFPGSRGSEWAWLSGGSDRQVLVARDGGALSATFQPRVWRSSQPGAAAPWNVRQEWVFIRDRLVGLVALAPDGDQTAEEVQMTVILGNGGTRAGKPLQAEESMANTFRYGDLVVQVHASTFGPAGLVPTKIRNAPAYDLVLGDPRSDTAAAVSSGWQAVIEIRQASATPATVKAHDGALEVATATGTWTLWHLPSGAPEQAIPVPAGALVALPGKDPAPKPATLRLKGGERALVISGQDAKTKQQPWASFAALAGNP